MQYLKQFSGKIIIIIKLLNLAFMCLLFCCRSSAENRTAALDWLWGCLDANSARGKLWSSTGMDRELTGMMTVPDGFALNLEAVALRLCAPFCSPPEGQEVHPKLLTVDPSFCAVESGPFSRGGLHQQTCMLPPPNDDQEKVVKCLD